MNRYSKEPTARNHVKRYEFLSFMRSLSNKFRKKLLNTATKTGLDALKTASKKAVHEIAEATGELIRNKIGEKVVKPKPVLDVNSTNFEEIFIPTEKRQEILNKIRKVL